MVITIVLLAIALVLLTVSYFFFTGMPDSRTSHGKTMRLLLAGTAFFIITALGVGIAIKIQENTGAEIGISGGLESDARQWVSRQRSDPPTVNQPGDNIRILREGLTFLRNHPVVGNTPEAQNITQQYGMLPERPTRLLTRQEEIQYYEGAKAVYELISRIAGEFAPATVNE